MTPWQPTFARGLRAFHLSVTLSAVVAEKFIVSAQGAVDCWLEAAREDHWPIPTPSPLRKVAGCSETRVKKVGYAFG